MTKSLLATWNESKDSETKFNKISDVFNVISDSAKRRYENFQPVWKPYFDHLSPLNFTTDSGTGYFIRPLNKRANRCNIMRIGKLPKEYIVLAL